MILKKIRNTNMKTHRYLLLSLFALFSVSLTGCFGVSDDFLMVKHHLLKNVKSGYKKEAEFGVGKISLSFAKMIVGFADDDDDAKEILTHISGAEVGVYKLYDNSLRSDPKKIISEMEQRGWTYIVKSFSPTELHLIFVHYNKSGLFTDIFVVACENRELKLVRARGDLEKVVEYAIREKDADFGFAKK